MQVPLEFHQRGLTDPQIEVARRRVEKQLERLHHLAPDLIACRVAVDRPQVNQKSGSPWRVRIEVTLSGHKHLVVDRHSDHGHIHEELDTAVHDGFRAMERMIKPAVEKRRGDVKQHGAGDDYGFVVRLFPEEDYGFLKTEDGTEVYFHRNAVVHDDFERLTIGTQVRFVDTMGDKGLQASTVQIIDKPGVRADPPRGEINPGLPIGWER